MASFASCLNGHLEAAIEFDIERHDTVSSTNDIVKQAIANGCEEGFVAVAKEQTAGYGRRGHEWSSEPGNLYMSVLLRPKADVRNLHTLGLMAAIAVRRTIASFVDEADNGRIKVKWPNDVIVVGLNGEDGVASQRRFHKICGISVELIEGAICMGIGINVAMPTGEGANKAEAALASAASSKASSMDNHAMRNVPAYIQELTTNATGNMTPTCEAILQKLLACLDEAYGIWLAESFSGLRYEFNDASALQGLRVKVCKQDDVQIDEGIVVGVDDSGRLMLDHEDGTAVSKIVDGTIIICS